MDCSNIIVAYVCGVGHSGSTLLDMLIGSHSQAWSTGELKRLSPDRYRTHWQRKGWLPVLHDRCTCGAARILDCPFWQHVDAVLHAHAALTLAEVEMFTPEPATFVTHNEALFGALATAGNTAVIVDSSKHLSRLRRLMTLTRLEVRPLLLERRPEGVVYSYIKRGQHWIYVALQYTAAMLRFREYLQGKPYLPVQYELLASQPEATMSRVMAWLDQPYEPAQLYQAAHIQHLLFGNPARFRPDRTIRLDEAWRTGLTPAQKLAIRLITLPARRQWSAWHTPYRRVVAGWRSVRVIRS